MYPRPRKGWRRESGSSEPREEAWSHDEVSHSVCLSDAALSAQILDERFACESEATLQGSLLDDHLGHTLAVGDWNHDGYDDLATAGIHKGPDDFDEVRVWVFLGGANGLETEPSHIIQDVPMVAGVGPAIAFVRDMNAGGRPELIVGAPGATSTTGDVHAGKVAVFFGESVSFPGNGTQPLTLADADVTYQGGAPDELLGASVASAGDIDGDGAADLVFGAPGPLQGSAIGKAYILLGPSVIANASWGSGFTWLVSTSGDIELHGQIAGGRYGYAVKGVGDVDGDGFDEVVVGEPAITYVGPFQWDADTAGRAYLYRHAEFDPQDPMNPGVSLPSEIGAFYPAGAYSTHAFGFSLAGRVDTNFDGRPEILVGAPLFEDMMNCSLGAVYVFSVSTTGEISAAYDAGTTAAVLPEKQPVTYPVFPPPPPDLDNLDAKSLFGISLDRVGSWDPDEFGDWAAGAPIRSNDSDDVICPLQGGRQTGRAFVIRGGNASTPFPPVPLARYKGERQAGGAGRTRLGTSVASGDFDGVGAPDIVTGGSAYTADVGMGQTISEAGRAYEFRNDL